MSVKIYDAYCMPVLKPKEFHAFIQLIRNHCLDCIDKEYFHAVANTVSTILDRIHLYQKKKSLLIKAEIDVPHYIEDLYQKSYTISTEISCIQLAAEFIDQYTRNRTREHILSPLHADNTLVLFPLYNNQIAFQVFGHWAQTFIQDICYAGPHTPLSIYKEQYQIMDYHYQNQADKPKEISEVEWNLRRIKWEELLPTGFPMCDGTPILITDLELYHNPPYEVKRLEHFQEKVLSNILPTEKRCQKFAYEWLLTTESKSNKNPTPSDYADLSAQIRDGIYSKSSSNPYYQKYLKLTDTLKQYLPDITIESLSTLIPKSI